MNFFDSLLHINNRALNQGCHDQAKQQKRRVTSNISLIELLLEKGFSIVLFCQIIRNNINMIMK